jgi:hypothetical protein
MLMRVLTTGRAVLVLTVSLVLPAGALALALPASAGVPAPAGHRGGVQVAVTGTPVDATSGAVLGPAVKYVRETDGTVRRVR